MPLALPLLKAFIKLLVIIIRPGLNLLVITLLPKVPQIAPFTCIAFFKIFMGVSPQTPPRGRGDTPLTHLPPSALRALLGAARLMHSLPLGSLLLSILGLLLSNLLKPCCFIKRSATKAAQPAFITDI